MTTPGKTLVEALSRQLPPNMVWDEAEVVTLGMIEAAADRLAVLRKHFDAASKNSGTSPASLATLGSGCRLTEATIARWAASLDPHNETAKSLRHVAAANARWHRASDGA